MLSPIVTTARTKATIIELPTKPATSAHAGSGVARFRLRMPSSRSADEVHGQAHEARGDHGEGQDPRHVVLGEADLPVGLPDAWPRCRGWLNTTSSIDREHEREPGRQPGCARSSSARPPTCRPTPPRSSVARSGHGASSPRPVGCEVDVLERRAVHTVAASSCRPRSERPPGERVRARGPRRRCGRPRRRRRPSSPAGTGRSVSGNAVRATRSGSSAASGSRRRCWSGVPLGHDGAVVDDSDRGRPGAGPRPCSGW